MSIRLYKCMGKTFANKDNAEKCKDDMLIEEEKRVLWRLVELKETSKHLTILPYLNKGERKFSVVDNIGRTYTGLADMNMLDTIDSIRMWNTWDGKTELKEDERELLIKFFVIPRYTPTIIELSTSDDMYTADT
jgi:hypothetical protein